MTNRVLTALIALVITCGAAQASDSDAWLRSRRAEYALWQKTNLGTQARIARLKAKTATQLRNHAPGALTDPAVVYRVIGAITHIWDIAVAPHLTVVPAGEFTMGSSESEPDRQNVEGPQHRVMISYPLAVGTFMVTRDEYAAFVADTLRPDPIGCFLTYRSGEPGETNGYNWHNPGFGQSGSDPVVCVSWEDARAYADWLTRKTGERYRLLSEGEWEFASRGGTATVRPWGDAISHENAKYRADPGVADRWTYTAPSGSYAPNAFGIYDALGNTWQRVDDCWNPSFDGAPTDGSVWLNGDCSQRTGHGGSVRCPVIRHAFGVPRQSPDRYALRRWRFPHRTGAVDLARS